VTVKRRQACYELSFELLSERLVVLSYRAAVAGVYLALGGYHEEGFEALSLCLRSLDFFASWMSAGK
jgi:hypothetical protein